MGLASAMGAKKHIYNPPSPPKAFPNRTYIDDDDNRKKILFISSNSCIGGVEKVVLSLLKNLDREKYHITMVVTRIKGVLHSEYEKHSDYCFYLSDSWQLKNFMKKFQFDVYNIFNSILALQHIDLMDGVVINSIFGDYSWKGHWYSLRIEQFLNFISQIDAVTTDNPSNIALFNGFPIHIPNGITFTAEYIPKDDKDYICWLGRDSCEKQPDAVIKTALANPELNFLVCISDLMSTSNNYLHIDKMKEIENIDLYVNANAETVKECLEKSSIYWNSSYSEGMPIAFLEGLANGCYPVINDIGDMPSVIERIGIGIVTDIENPANVKDYGKWLKEGIKEYAKDKEGTYWNIVNEGRKIHGIDQFIEKFEAVYEGELRADRTSIEMRAKRTSPGIRRQPIQNRIRRFTKNMNKGKFDNDKMKLATQLYFALFYLNIKKNVYWLHRVKNQNIDITVTELLDIAKKNINTIHFRKIEKYIAEIKKRYG